MSNIEYHFKKIFGLKPHKKDWRDYSHHRTFGSAPLSDLPDEYMLVSDILDQNGFPKCTSFSSCAVKASKEGIEFDPDWFYAREGDVAGQVSTDGYDLRTAMQTGVDKGFKPMKDGQGAPDQFCEGGYFAIDGPYDLFDNIRSAMWMAQKEKRCGEIGTMWYDEWFYANKGFVLQGAAKEAGLHAIKCAGWKKVNGVICLLMQNSFGKNFGDGGLYYFQRETANKEFTEGAFMWRALTDKQVKTANSILDLFKKILKLIEQWAGQ